LRILQQLPKQTSIDNILYGLGHIYHTIMQFLKQLPLVLTSTEQTNPKVQREKGLVSFVFLNQSIKPSMKTALDSIYMTQD